MARLLRTPRNVYLVMGLPYVAVIVPFAIISSIAGAIDRGAMWVARSTADFLDSLFESKDEAPVRLRLVVYPPPLAPDRGTTGRR